MRRLLPPIPGVIFYPAKSDPFVIFQMGSKVDLLSHGAYLLNDSNSETDCFTILHNTPFNNPCWSHPESICSPGYLRLMPLAKSYNVQNRRTGIYA